MLLMYFKFTIILIVYLLPLFHKCSFLQYILQCYLFNQYLSIGAVFGMSLYYCCEVGFSHIVHLCPCRSIHGYRNWSFCINNFQTPRPMFNIELALLKQALEIYMYYVQSNTFILIKKQILLKISVTKRNILDVRFIICLLYQSHCYYYSRVTYTKTHVFKLQTFG